MKFISIFEQSLNKGHPRHEYVFFTIVTYVSHFPTKCFIQNASYKMLMFLIMP